MKTCALVFFIVSLASSICKAQITDFQNEKTSIKIERYVAHLNQKLVRSGSPRIDNSSQYTIHLKNLIAPSEIIYLYKSNRPPYSKRSYVGKLTAAIVLLLFGYVVVESMQ